MSTALTVSCPQCGTSVPWTAESKWKPFCCERCKLIDLGEWAAEKYRVEGESPDPGEHDISEP